MDVAEKLRVQYAPLRAGEIAGEEAARTIAGLRERIEALAARTTLDTAKSSAAAGTLRALAEQLEVDLSDKSVEALVKPILNAMRSKFDAILNGQPGGGAPAARPAPPTKGVVATDSKARVAVTSMERRTEPEQVAEVAVNGTPKPTTTPVALPPPDHAAATTTPPPPPPPVRVGSERLTAREPAVPPTAADEAPPPPPPPGPSAAPPEGDDGPPEPARPPIPGVISTVTERARKAMALVAKPKKGAQNRSDAMFDPDTGDRIPVEECIVVDDATPDISEAGGDVTIHPEE